MNAAARPDLPSTADGQPRAPLISLRAISKNYGSVHALSEVDLDVFDGEVLAICGDNGAGKSSLIWIISGALEASSGSMWLRGREVSLGNPNDALVHGVATIYQDLALAPRMSVYQNIFMGAELTRPFLPFLPVLDKKRMIAEARRLLGQLRSTIADMTAPVENLSGGQRQAVAISRALRWNAEVIIMDEPTAALGVKETAQVLDLIRHLRDGGATIILISHNMSEVVKVATRVVILKSGRKIIDRPIGGLDADTLSHMVMTGKAADGSVTV